MIKIMKLMALTLIAASSAQAASKMNCRVFSLTGILPITENFEMDVRAVERCGVANHTQQIAKTAWSVRAQFNAACDKPGKESGDFIGLISISAMDPNVEAGARVSNLENDDAGSRPTSQRLNMIGTHGGQRSHIQIDCKIN